jgi:hypothetical protein
MHDSIILDLPADVLIKTLQAGRKMQVLGAPQIEPGLGSQKW